MKYLFNLYCICIEIIKMIISNESVCEKWCKLKNKFWIRKVSIPWRIQKNFNEHFNCDLLEKYEGILLIRIETFHFHLLPSIPVKDKRDKFNEILFKFISLEPIIIIIHEICKWPVGIII